MSVFSEKAKSMLLQIIYRNLTNSLKNANYTLSQHDLQKDIYTMTIQTNVFR